MEIMKKPEPLSVILPPPTSTVSLQSCSTTGSSVLSVFTNTPLPSIGDIESSTIASTTEASVVTARPLREILTNSEPPKQSLPPFESLFDGMDREEDLLDVYSLVVDCCEGSKEKVISRLARASQFRLLNPAFLMGDLSAPPFVTSEELNDFLMERPSSTIKVKVVCGQFVDYRLLLCSKSFFRRRIKRFQSSSPRPHPHQLRLWRRFRMFSRLRNRKKKTWEVLNKI